MLKFVVAFMLFAALAHAQCEAVGECGETFSSEFLSLISSIASNQNFDRTTEICRLYRAFLGCVIDKCPEIGQETNLLAQFESQAAGCGFVLPGQFSGKIGFCALAGDPHVRSFDGKFGTCALENPNGVEVFNDGTLIVSIVANANPQWNDQTLTAIRSVTVTKGTESHTFAAGTASFTGTGTSGTKTVVSHAITDTAQKFNIRVAEFANSDKSQQWLNIYLKAPPPAEGASTPSGPCVTGCPGSKKGIDPVAFQKQALRHARNARMTAACDSVTPADAKAACITDVMNTGDEAFARSAADFGSEEKLNGASIATLSGAVALLVALVAALL